ncbi:MAG TPA: hypothetical protein VK714_03025 [Myxococcota bacterium]|nr:hypothetical protein [Myxococcota bacterium]
MTPESVFPTAARCDLHGLRRRLERLALSRCQGRIMSLVRLAAALLTLCLLATQAMAEPLAPRDAPEPLRPWVGWVMRGHESELCPAFVGDTGRHACAWPARLLLEADASGAHFSQEWQVYADGFVPLPGDEKTWPQDVKVDELPVAVVLREGVPSVRLPIGSHRASGTFLWDAPPALLALPPEIGLLSLRLRGEPVPFPARDDEGRLWLERRAGAGGEEDKIELHATRLVEDEVPLVVETRIDLQVAGKSRELTLPSALLPNLLPMSLESALPARIEQDGRLVLQIRPGRWQVTLKARSEGPTNELTLPVPPQVPAPPTPKSVGPEEAFDASEVWAFSARPELRLVDVAGGVAVDPQQTLLPTQWRSYPAYLMQPGATLRLVERRRGDADPAPDQLTLSRTLWLDFDGAGYTVHDVVGGTMTRSWRLEVGPEMTLGRVAVGGIGQLVTKLPGAQTVGVEVREARPQLEADARLEGLRARIPAVGWRSDFSEIAATLNLPPGWRLFHAAGVDDASPTWIASWSLLDLFLVLITALAAGRLFGRTSGLVTLLALALSWTEPSAPHWLWAAILAAEAAVRVLPLGRVRDGARLLRLGLLVALVIFGVPFLVQEVREATYPGLEPPEAGASSAAEPSPATLEAPSPEQAYTASGAAAPISPRKAAVLSSSALQKTAQRWAPDPSALIPTGPGLPRWRWQTVTLRWRGPVQSAQELQLWLIPPAGNFALAWLRVGLVALLAGVLLRAAARGNGPLPGAAAGPGEGSGRGRAAGSAAVSAALALAAATLAGDARADYPPQALLDSLRERLVAPPECSPRCAAIPRLRVEAVRGTLRARLELEVAFETGVPLPGSARGWSPSTVMADSAPARSLLRDSAGVLWIALPPGRHQIVMEGPLPERAAVEIPLPLRPARVEAPEDAQDGWRVEGIHEDGVPGENLQLVRTRRADENEQAEAPLQLPPFVRIERQLELGLEWQVTTRVVRVAPMGTAIVLAVPLLPGESVTTEGVRVEAGRVAASLPPEVSELAWSSVLAQADVLALQAPDTVPWTEVWRIDASPIWHVEASGIPPIQRAAAGEGSGLRVREFQPWPGEEVRLVLSRPESVPGQTLTLDSVSLSHAPGLRASDSTLELVLRSSRGGQHAVTLPSGAELQSVQIAGKAQPIRLEDGKVTLPVVPGRQTVAIAWREPSSIAQVLRTPEVDLGAPAVNVSLHIRPPGDRWVLGLAGPRRGPAVLFWSLLAVVALIAAGLGRLRITPLRSWHWMLLGVGLTQVPVFVGAIVVGWLLALGWRREQGASLGDRAFRGLQLTLAIWTPIALAGLFFAIEQGLLGLPQMQVRGNGSSASELLWYQDRSGAFLPRALMLSVPLLVYRAAMLAWALWLAFALLGWLRWGWTSFSQGGLWRPWRQRRAGKALGDRLSARPEPPPQASP